MGAAAEERRCTRCGEVKDLSEFTPGMHWCKPCNAAYVLERRAAMDDAARERLRDRDGQYRDAHRDQRRDQHGQYRDAHRDQRRDQGRQYTARLRAAALALYGAVCACCGETRVEKLAIDHVFGGGKRHVREMFRSWHAFYRWLIDIGRSPAFQVLCQPCNMSKRDGPRCRLNHRRRAA